MANKDLGVTCLDEFYVFMKGKLLGEGMTRAVYDHPSQSNLVIKVENSSGYFQNVLEWETWLKFKDTKVSKWLAPCHSISYSGTFLIMEKTKPIPLRLVPKKLPFFLDDIKLDNLGIYKGRVVCHDYGYLNLIAETKLKKCNL